MSWDRKYLVFLSYAGHFDWIQVRPGDQVVRKEEGGTPEEVYAHWEVVDGEGSTVKSFERPVLETETMNQALRQIEALSCCREVLQS